MYLKKVLKSSGCLLLIGLSALSFWAPLKAQSEPDPQGAFLRSLVIPGWGHYYADNENWTRGQIHLGADLVLIGSYFGLNARAGNIEEQFTTLAQLHAGVSIDDRDRTYLLALGQYNNLEEYNDFQLRSRNWDRIIPDTPENRWQWDSEADRQNYQELRQNRESARNQLPAIAGLMIVNRVVSAISAYRRARDQSGLPDISFAPVIHNQKQSGVLANLSITF